VLAFGAQDNERSELGSTVKPCKNRPDADPAGIQISCIADEPQAADSLAVAAGAVEVYALRRMPWGQSIHARKSLPWPRACASI
jgi:hypothetical protein